MSNSIIPTNKNKSIRDKELKILKYYKNSSTNFSNTKLEKPKRRTRKHIQIEIDENTNTSGNSNINSTDGKLINQTKLQINEKQNEKTKKNIVIMD
jgi:K+-transporting ATPase c subunit